MRSRLCLGVAVLLLAVPLSAAQGSDDVAAVGQWAAPFWEGGATPYDPPSLEKSAKYPTAVNTIALPDGRVLYWSGLEGSENGDMWIGKLDGTMVLENARARLLDLGSGEPSWAIPELERGTTDEAKDEGKFSTKDLFCADQKLLYDGTLLVAGGSEWRGDLFANPAGIDVYGDDEARIFDPETNEFRNVDQLDAGRWYPTLVTLPDGRVLISSGVKRLTGSPEAGGTSWSQVRTSEIYDPRTEKWSPAGESEWSLPLYARLHLLPDGTVYFGGAGQTWGQLGWTPDMATWTQQRVYSPATQSWSAVGPTRYGVRGGATSTLLRLEPPYDRAQILLAGGTLGVPPGAVTATTLSEVITWKDGSIVPSDDRVGPLAGLAGDPTQLRQPRWFGTSVMLPTGEVLLTNGGDVDDTVDPGSAAAVRAPELYDPKTGTWRTLAPMSRDRVYHNTALLLPDGRVLVGGNAPHSAHFTRHDNPATRSNNFKDATFQIYEPPYLFRGDRPTIDSLSIGADRRSLQLSATGADEVVLVRLGAVTHGQDSDMRAVVLEKTVNPDGTITAALPGNGDGSVVPPGPYYVFANTLGPDGAVPSVARTVLVQPDDARGGVVFATT